MKRRGREFYYYITDKDQMLFNCIGPITSDLELNKKVVEAMDSGRNVRASSNFDLDSKDSHIQFYTSQGYKLTTELLINTPLDRSKEYTSSLPDYAKHANKNRIVKFLCHTCSATRYGEMTVDYPGENKLSNSQLKDYEARCLKCGNIANDPYNWFR